MIRSAVLLAATVAVVGLAGFGGGSGKDDAAATMFAKVPTKFGEVTIPAEPKRVVALGWGDAETALALGVQPVGASDWLAFGRYDTLKAIAPTVGVPAGGDAYKVSWEKQTEMVAAALGRVDQGRQLIAATKERFSQTVAQHPEFAGKTITLGSRTSDG